MSVTIPTTEPTEIRAGDSVKWTRSLSDYPASTWTLSYALRGPGEIDITASADGDDHSVSELPATTAGWTEGIYNWVAKVTDGTDTYTIDEGTVEILEDLAAVTGAYDGRSHAKKVLDAIEAVIEGRASQDQMSYTIAGRSLARTPIPDLLKLRDRYRAEYAQEGRAEKAANSKGHAGRILARFK